MTKDGEDFYWPSDEERQRDKIRSLLSILAIVGILIYYFLER